MRSLPLLFVLVPAAGLAQSEPLGPQPKPVPELTDAQFERELRTLQREIDTKLASMKVPGAAVVVVKDGKVRLMRGFGLRDVERKKPVTPDTIFMIASCTKAFVGTSLLLAVDQGLLRLDDSPKKYLPYFSLRDPEADQRITVADLMCHSSGLPRIDLPWLPNSLNAEQNIRALGLAKPTFLFRENAQYSNILTHAAAEVAAAVFKQPWEQVVRERLWQPLGMTSTTLESVAKIDPDRMAKGYWLDPVSGKVRQDVTLDTGGVPGAGSIKSSVRDLAQWLRFHLAGGELDGKRLLRREILEEAYKPRQATNDYDSYGLGWVTHTNRLGTRAITHGGYLDGFQSQVCLYPERKLGIAVLTNNAGLGADSVIRDLIVSRLIGKQDTKWNDQYAKEVGVYVDPQGRRLLRIIQRGAALWAIPNQEKAIRLRRTGFRTYHTADPRNTQLVLSFGDFKGPLAKKGEAEVRVQSSGDAVLYQPRVKLGEGVSAESLMDKVVEAEGGREALSKPRNLVGRFTNTYENEGVWALGLMHRSGNDEYGLLEHVYYGDRRLFANHFGVGVKRGGEVADFGRVGPFVGAGLRNARASVKVSQALDWRKLFAKVELLAVTELEGVKHYVVRKTPRLPGNAMLDFISADTHLVTRREEGAAPVVRLFSDYRTVDGVMLPHKVTQIDDGFRRQVMAFTEIRPADRYYHWAYNPLDFKR